MSESAVGALALGGLSVAAPALAGHGPFGTPTVATAQPAPDRNDGWLPVSIEVGREVGDRRVAEQVGDRDVGGRLEEGEHHLELEVPGQ